MSIWDTYIGNSPLVQARDLVGETLEYLDHTVRKSAYHPKFNPNNDKNFAVINAIHHSGDTPRPVSVAIGSPLIMNWLKHIERSIQPGEKIYFRLTYDDKVPSGTARWGVENAS